MLKQVVHCGEVYAIILYSSYKDQGISFFTPTDFPQQLGYMNRPKGYVVAPHKHSFMQRSVFQSQEVLFVRSGKIKVSIYNLEGAFLEEVIISTGDIILLAAGGHGLEWLEDGEMIEVKQGPYLDEEDKVMFG